MVKAKRICPVCGEPDDFIKYIDGKYFCLTCGYEESMADADRKFRFDLKIEKIGYGTVSIDGNNITSFPVNYEIQKYTDVTLQSVGSDEVPITKAFSCSNASGTPAYTDETQDINSSTANDVALPPIQISNVGDAIYFGADEVFSKIRINVGRAGVYSGVTLQWQYYKSTGWTALSNVTDNTNGFKVQGTNNVTFTLPSDWVKTTVNDYEAYWVRCIVTTLSSPSLTTAPLGTQAWYKSKFSKYMIENIGTGFKGVYEVTNDPLILPMVCKRKVTVVFVKD